MADVAAALAVVRQRIEAAGADVDRVAVVAVTKGFGADAVEAAVAAGLVDIGENYAQELVAKATDPRAAGARWHFIGRVQRNKVVPVASHVACWQTVERIEVGEAIARVAPGATVLVQVNASGESRKGGCRLDDAPALIGRLQELDLDVSGLMTIGPSGPPETARPAFRAVAALAADLGLHEVSMGMSADLEVAVEEGSTMVRVGGALFGPRARGHAQQQRR